MKIAIISDTQGNAPAFRTVLSKFDEDIDIKVHLGNIVGACPYPDECVNLAVADFNYILRGKTDNALISIDNAMAFSPIEKEAAEWNVVNASEVSRELIDGLEFAHAKGELLFVNGSPSHVSRAIHSPDDAEKSFSNPIMPFEIAFVGGTGMPSIWSKSSTGEVSFLRPNYNSRGEATYDLKEDSKYIINVGAVGLPKDNDPRSSYVIYDTETRKITLYRIAYGIDKTVGKMQQKGFSTNSYMRLLYGK